MLENNARKKSVGQENVSKLCVAGRKSVLLLRCRTWKALSNEMKGQKMEIQLPWHCVFFGQEGNDKAPTHHFVHGEKHHATIFCEGINVATQQFDKWDNYYPDIVMPMAWHNQIPLSLCNRKWRGLDATRLEKLLGNWLEGGWLCCSIRWATWSKVVRSVTTCLR